MPATYTSSGTARIEPPPPSSPSDTPTTLLNTITITT
jgi:hypothetical protein